MLHDLGHVKDPEPFQQLVHQVGSRVLSDLFLFRSVSWGVFCVETAVLGFRRCVSVLALYMCARACACLFVHTCHCVSVLKSRALPHVAKMSPSKTFEPPPPPALATGALRQGDETQRSAV